MDMIMTQPVDTVAAVNSYPPVHTYPLATIPPVDPEPPAPSPDPLPPGPSPDPVPPTPQPTPLPGTPDPLPPAPGPDTFELPRLDQNPYITADLAATYVNPALIPALDPAPYLTADLADHYASRYAPQDSVVPVPAMDLFT
jgi:hypothetical protein